MKMNVRLEDISDGRLYDINDMVKADTRGCHGCSACCHGMGDTIVLNPFDMYQIQGYTGKGFDELMDKEISLHLEGKITLPNLNMVGDTEACGFLDNEGRCSIHPARPGICRLFPLGRYYEDKDFKYIFKAGECVKSDLSKVKVKKWIGISDYSRNKAFILQWHGLLEALRWRVKFVHDDKELEAINDFLISTFFRDCRQKDRDFYEDFLEKLPRAKDRMGIL